MPASTRPEPLGCPRPRKAASWTRIFRSTGCAGCTSRARPSFRHPVRPIRRSSGLRWVSGLLSVLKRLGWKECLVSETRTHFVGSTGGHLTKPRCLVESSRRTAAGDLREPAAALSLRTTRPSASYSRPVRLAPMEILEAYDLAGSFPCADANLPERQILP